MHSTSDTETEAPSLQVFAAKRDGCSHIVRDADNGRDYPFATVTQAMAAAAALADVPGYAQDLLGSPLELDVYMATGPALEIQL